MGSEDKPRFRGRSLTKLDAKGRLRIPVKFREVLQKHYTDSLIVSQFSNCLVAHPPEQWEKIEANALDNLSQFHPDHRAFVRGYISGAEDCEFDSQGRILIPPMLREDAHLDQDVVIVGMLSNFEIWDKSAYELQVKQDRQNEQKTMETIAVTGL